EQEPALRQLVADLGERGAEISAGARGEVACGAGAREDGASRRGVAAARREDHEWRERLAVERRGGRRCEPVLRRRVAQLGPGGEERGRRGRLEGLRQRLRAREIDESQPAVVASAHRLDGGATQVERTRRVEG